MLLILAARKYHHHKQRKEEEEQARLAATTTYDPAPALANLDLKQQALATETHTINNANANVKPARGCCSGRKPQSQHQQRPRRSRRCCRKSSRPRDLPQSITREVETVGAGAGAAVPYYHPAERYLVVDKTKTSDSGTPRSIDTKVRFATASSSEENLPTYDDEDEVEVDDAYGRVEDVEGGLPLYTELKG